VAGILSQTATVFTLFFSWLILKEGLSVQKVLGAVAAIAGALVIGLGSAAP
jgi:drug/metabolite transporter (DMT)-like permease